MKFVIAAVVMFALAFGANASVWPWPYGIPAIAAPHGIATIAGHTLVAGPAVIPAHVPATISLSQGPAIVAAHAPAVVAAHAPAIVAAEGTYVAKTRGAVHTAPLAGHLNSASSINLEPAPGTI